MEGNCHRIGFVSTRLAGTDGVSLETAKWEQTLTGFGERVFFFAGEIDRPAESSYLVPEAHFNHPGIAALQESLIGQPTRSEEVSRSVEKLKNHLKAHLKLFVRRFDLDLLILENTLSLPMNIPLGLAITELIAETGMPAVAHHHDFSWERSRFSINAANDYLGTAFPPNLRSIRHVVINSFAARQLALRTGNSSAIIPNVMDFAHPPAPSAVRRDQLAADLEIEPGDHILLQPTRVVPRKRIELAVELARRLELDCALVISHASGDEGGTYMAYLQDYARLLGVKTRYVDEIVSATSGRAQDGKRIYALADLYQQADLVTYPSAIEGFGNAFLESIYYSKPIVMSTYAIFKTDIEPRGFKVIGFDQFISEETVRQVRRLLQDPAGVEEMVVQNYAVGQRYFSYATLEKHLSGLINICLGD